MDIVPQSPYERLAPLRNDINKRLASFQNKWPRDAPVSPQDLAQDFFYYIGYEDKVQCTHCGGILSGWCRGDVVSAEHARHFPHCPWVQRRQAVSHPAQYMNVADSIPAHVGTSQGFNFGHQSHGQNFDLRYQASFNARDKPGVTRPKFPEYAVETIRKATYRGWPSQMKQTPELLTKAGFFYLGEGDKVKCFYCGGILWDWEQGDEPWEEHAKWFPDCPWLKMAKGDDYIERIQQELNRMQIDEENENAEQTPVKAVGNEETRVKDSGADRGQSASGTQVCQPSDAASASPSHHSQRGAEAVGITSIGALSGKEKVDVKALIEENEALKSSTSCKICMDATVDVIFLPCGHICCCASCAAPLQVCPICRKKIDKAVKAYLA